MLAPPANAKKTTLQATLPWTHLAILRVQVLTQGLHTPIVPCHPDICPLLPYYWGLKGPLQHNPLGSMPIYLEDWVTPNGMPITGRAGTEGCLTEIPTPLIGPVQEQYRTPWLRGTANVTFILEKLSIVL